MLWRARASAAEAALMLCSVDWSPASGTAAPLLGAERAVSRCCRFMARSQEGPGNDCVVRSGRNVGRFEDFAS